MPRYQSKPVTVEAVQYAYDGSNAADIIEAYPGVAFAGSSQLVVSGAGGSILLNPGDYVVIGDGGYTRLTEAAFHELYEEVEE